MATATTLGPIGINQINNVFYVADEGGFPNIQAAVDYAQRYNAGVGHIVIVHGYTGSEAMSSIVRGASGIYINDTRSTLMQNWEWNSTEAVFVPADFQQLSSGQFGGLLKGYGFVPLDLTASHTSIGTGHDNTIPAVSLIKANNPVDQKLWVMAAGPTSLYFSAADDSGQDHTWMQVMRTAAGAASSVIVTPPMQVGALSSQGSPVRTFANSSDGGGGGGTGGVNPGTQGQLSFYGEDGPLISPSLITTDVATQSNLTIPALVTSAQATTNYSTFADRTSANWGYTQEHANMSVGGAGINVGSPWSVNSIGYDTIVSAQRGISQIRAARMDRYAIGDTAGLYYYVYTDGGAAAGSDEGVTLLSGHARENAGYFHGTVKTTTGYGDQAPTYNFTSGNPHTTDGAFMLNISLGQLAGNWNGASVVTYMDTGAGATSTFLNQLPVTSLVVTAAAWSSTINYAAGNIVSSGGSNYVSLTFGNHGFTPASSPTKWAVLPSGQLPISTAIGVVDSSSLPIPLNNAPTTQPISRTLKVNLVKIGGAFPGFAVNDVVTVAGLNYPEQTIISAASTTGTQQTLTMKLRNLNNQAILFKGGIQGQYISMDANLAFSGMRSSYYALGSQTGTDLIYALNVNGNVAGNTLPQLTCEAATASGAGSGFHLYPGAEVICNPTINYDGTLEQNGVRWQVGDTVENPHYPAFTGAAIGMNKYQQTPCPNSGATSGFAIELSGPGFAGRPAAAIFIRSESPSTWFYGDGGPVQAPQAIQLVGYYSSGLNMSNGPQPEGACLWIQAPSSPTTNPNAPVNLVHIDYNSSGNLTYYPAAGNLGTWLFSGSSTISAQAASFNSGQFQLYGAYDHSVIIFNPQDGSGAGNPRQIYSHAYPPDFATFYDTNHDGAHIFRSAPYGGTVYTIMSCDQNGLTVALGGITAPTLTAPTSLTTPLIALTNSAASGGAAVIQFSATGTGLFQLGLWGAGNSDGLAGILGLFNNAKGNFVWSTNPTGDVFFNVPLTNVIAGTGATTSITAAGVLTVPTIDTTYLTVATDFATPYVGVTNTTVGSGPGIDFTAAGTDVFRFYLWGTGNGGGTPGAFALYDATRGGIIWNTNANGDMFFNTPISGTSNVAAGVGALARITAAGLIDATAYSVAGVAGVASGSFTTADSKTVTVTHGLITAIV
jgi:hypothetical protein